MQETYRAKRHFTSNNAVGGNHFIPPTALRFPTYRAKAFHLPRLWLPPPAFALSRFVLPAGYDGFADNVRGNARWLLRFRG